MNAIVTPLTRIAGRSARAIARVGAIAIDQDRRVLGLTARHVLFSDPEEDIYDIDSPSREPIGRRIKWPYSDFGSRKFFDTIAAFELTADAAMATQQRAIHSFVHFDDCLGRTVFKLSDKLNNPKGRVTGVGGAIRFKDPYALSSDVMRDYVEVLFQKPQLENAAPGEAGSLIIDDRDQAIGLLMGGDAERAFVAPLQPFLTAFKLDLAPSSADALRDAPEEMGLELERANAGRAQLRRDLRSERTIHVDPEGDSVPAHLVAHFKKTLLGQT